MVGWFFDMLFSEFNFIFCLLMFFSKWQVLHVWLLVNEFWWTTICSNLCYFVVYNLQLSFHHSANPDKTQKIPPKTTSDSSKRTTKKTPPSTTDQNFALTTATAPVLTKISKRKLSMSKHQPISIQLLNYILLIRLKHTDSWGQLIGRLLGRIRRIIFIWIRRLIGGRRRIGGIIGGRLRISDR